MRNPCDVAKMSFNVAAALPFKAHTNNGTWSIDFEKSNKKDSYFGLKLKGVLFLIRTLFYDSLQFVWSFYHPF